MNPSPQALDSDSAWSTIAGSSDQPAAYFAWCRNVLLELEQGRIDDVTAAKMIGYREDMSPFPQLESSGDAQLLMSYAEDITDGCAYADSPDARAGRWSDISSILQRHR